MNDLQEHAVLIAADQAQSTARSEYDQALGYARFVQTRINAALLDVFKANNFPALASSHIANVRGLINDFAQAKYTLTRSYLRLCEAMDWDDDEARAAGIVSEVKL